MNFQKLLTIVNDPRTWAVVLAVIVPYVAPMIGIDATQATAIATVLAGWVFGEAWRPTQIGLTEIKAYLESRRAMLAIGGVAITYLSERLHVSKELLQQIAYAVVGIIMVQSLTSSEKPNATQ